jgi:IS30 family transposase
VTVDPVRPDPLHHLGDEQVTQPSPARLSLQEREEIRVGPERGDTFTAIANELGRAVSTVTREVNGNGGREGYRTHLAHQAAFERARRPKTPKLACPRLAGQAAEWLEMFWSPEQIANRLQIEFPDDPMMRVSHETIYMSLFVEGRCQLRRELSRCLRTGRAQRRPRSRIEIRGKILEWSWSPSVLPRWRTAPSPDIGKDHWAEPAVGSRHSGRAHLPLPAPAPLASGREAVKVNHAMKAAIGNLPDELVRTITWDQGREMDRHLDFTVDTGVNVYFCDPHSPWQRGSNVNTNGVFKNGGDRVPREVQVVSVSEEDEVVVTQFDRLEVGRPAAPHQRHGRLHLAAGPLGAAPPALPATPAPP